jgi:signal transduction histidine kinase
MSKQEFGVKDEAGAGRKRSFSYRLAASGLALLSAVLCVLSALSGILWLPWGAATAAVLAVWAIWMSVPAPASTEDFAARLITVQEEERKRLSRELHDGVGQVITALKMELSRVEGSSEDQIRLDRARSHADEALRSIRTVSRMLRPTLLDDLGLEAALQWHLEDFGRRTGIRAELSFELPVEDVLAETVNTCIYRTVQESLNNCEKHSGATLVRVTVSQENHGLVVSIADNGKGMKSASAAQDGNGIRGMRERAHILGGQLRVESNEGKGTTVNLNLPW